MAPTNSKKPLWLPDLPAMLDAHPLAQQLRQQDSHTEKDRKVAKLTEDKVEHFTTGTLATRSAFAQPPAIMISDATQTVLALWHLGPGLSGHKGVVHGGATCTIMDECLGGAALYTGRQGARATQMDLMTAELTVRYLAPIFTNSCVLIRATVQASESTARKIRVNGELWHVKEDGGDDVLAARGSALFIAIRPSL